MESKSRSPWSALLSFSRTATKARPTKAWLKEAEKLAGEVGFEGFKTRLIQWFALVKPPPNAREDPAGASLSDRNGDILKGLV